MADPIEMDNGTAMAVLEEWYSDLVANLKTVELLATDPGLIDRPVRNLWEARQRDRLAALDKALTALRKSPEP